MAVKWRTREDITVDLASTLPRHGVKFIHAATEKVNPEDNSVTMSDGQNLKYDYLVIATGPKLAFDEIEGLGPEGFTQSVCDVGAHHGQRG